MDRKIFVTIIICLVFIEVASAQYVGWKYSGLMYIITTPEGAGLPATSSENDFPLLVRLNSDFFNFSQAKNAGEDIRFSTGTGLPLAYDIEEWDSSKGTACIWVRIPRIEGNTRQEIKMYWGMPGAKSESSGKAVFNQTNGYLSVLHMNDSVADATGNIAPKNVGTTPKEGIIGLARNFVEGQGISGGDKITTYPVGANPSTTEAWTRVNKPNVNVIGWGNDERFGKVIMKFVSPPKIRMDCYFADANVSGNSKLSMNQWIQVVHTWQGGDSRVYVNGEVDGISNTVKNPLALKSPVQMWIGGWKNEYLFDGDIDEVRISKVVRSSDWIRLQYENQKPLNTLIGPLVKSGNNFSVLPAKLKVKEGERTTVNATAGGAQKIYWIIKRNANDSVVAVDQLSYTLVAGRIAGDQSFVLQFKAVYEKEVRIRNIPVTIKEEVPEPVFTLKAPSTWNGRDIIEVIPQISNLKTMISKGAMNLKYLWTVSGGAVISEITPDRLLLKRSQFSGKITVRLVLNNGGDDISASTSVMISEPESDIWVQRSPGKEEKPENNQFYARDDRNEGSLYYNGTLGKEADSVFLKIFADDVLYKKECLKLANDKAYAFAAKLKPGLIKYMVVFGSKGENREEGLDTVRNIVCGDAYIIDGQSNAEANDFGKAINPYTSEWVRSYGSAAANTSRARLKLWGNAVSYDNKGAKLQIGYWGIELAKHLVENQKMPVCIINGSVGGSRIDVHQRNEPDKEDPNTIYGRLFWRVKQAGLTHGIRGIFWHQGENDQGAAGPTGQYGWETYQQYFVDMSAAWKQDYPNIQHYYIFQIWPRSCSMTENGSDNMLREVQRTLPDLFSNMGIMSTLGIKPPGGCHFPPEGYAEIAHLICPLVERDNYGKVFTTSITPPDLKKAYFTNSINDEIVLEFDQPVVWKDLLISQFYLDGKAETVSSGSVSGKDIRLRLKIPATAKKITYLDSKSWSQDNILYGENGIAALTFFDVPILNMKNDTTVILLKKIHEKAAKESLN
jgi:hypothetical protein